MLIATKAQNTPPQIACLAVPEGEMAKNHCPNCQNLELAYLLNSLGETPNCFLKLVEKWERVLKPVISAIS